MTDYTSQGKTRKWNVVDLQNSDSHQSYYTALSRSSSAAGTLILQGFDARKVTGGASGALRQEFRELELLDEITRLRYEGKRKAKGDRYVPKNVHDALRWDHNKLWIQNSDEVHDWTVVEKPVKTLTAPPQPVLVGFAASAPIGPRWHDNSCAYDAVLSIIMALWRENPVAWTLLFSGTGNQWMRGIASGLASKMAVDDIRDQLCAFDLGQNLRCAILCL